MTQGQAMLGHSSPYTIYDCRAESQPTLQGVPSWWDGDSLGRVYRRQRRALLSEAHHYRKTRLMSIWMPELEVKNHWKEHIKPRRRRVTIDNSVSVRYRATIDKSEVAQRANLERKRTFQQEQSSTYSHKRVWSCHPFNKITSCEAKQKSLCPLPFFTFKMLDLWSSVEVLLKS